MMRLALLPLLCAAASPSSNHPNTVPSSGNNTRYRLVFTDYSDGPSIPGGGGPTAQVSVATGDTATGKENKTVLFTIGGGGGSGPGQLALSPDGTVLVYVSFCYTCMTPLGRQGGWSLNYTNVETASSPSSHHRIQVLDGGAGYPGQPVWAPDGSSLAFVTEGFAIEDGSLWNISVVKMNNGGAFLPPARVVDSVFAPATEDPAPPGQPYDTNWVQCIRPTYTSATQLVYAAWDRHSGNVPGLNYPFYDVGRLFSYDTSGNGPALSLVNSTTNTAFCRPVAAPNNNGSIAVTAYDYATNSWTAEVFRPAPKWSAEPYVFGERWPLNGVTSDHQLNLGVGQLQWRPQQPPQPNQQSTEQLALVEMNTDKPWTPNKPSFAVLKTLTLGSGSKQVVSLLNTSEISGEPRWSPDGKQLAFADYRLWDDGKDGGNWINLAEIGADGGLAGGGVATPIAATNFWKVDYDRHIVFLPLLPPP